MNEQAYQAGIQQALFDAGVTATQEKTAADCGVSRALADSFVAEKEAGVADIIGKLKGLVASGGQSIAGGAKAVGEKAMSGAKELGGKALGGAQELGGKAVAGAKELGGKAMAGAGAGKDAIMEAAMKNPTLSSALGGGALGAGGAALGGGDVGDVLLGGGIGAGVGAGGYQAQTQIPKLLQKMQGVV